VASVAVSPEVAQFVADHAGELPVTDEERMCLSERVASEPSLMAKAATDPVQQVLADAISVCKQRVSFAEAFVVGIAQSRPGLAPDQQDCLRQAYGALSPEDLDAVMATGVQPASASADRGRRVLDGLLRRCGL
jgi:hypothetical protein